MKKLLILSLLSVSFAFAETVDWETFQAKILDAYPFLEYEDLSFDKYKEWQGDADAYLTYLYTHGQCVAEDEAVIEILCKEN